MLRVKDARDVVTVASTIGLALSLVTPFGDAGVGVAAGLVLLGQGLYTLFRRSRRPDAPHLTPRAPAATRAFPGAAGPRTAGRG
jgi:hypothetical protein